MEFNAEQQDILTNNTLFRGTACLVCRRRKIKCDGRRPFCEQCRKVRLEDECQYDDGQHKSRHQLLTEQIEALQNRIQELEEAYNPEPEDDDEDHNQEDMAAQFIASLPEFLNHRFQLCPLISFYPGFKTPSKSLRNAICMIGPFFSSSIPGSSDPGATIRGLTNALATGENTTDIIIATCILAVYLFGNGRLVEGKYHANAAVTLALSGRLHQTVGQHADGILKSALFWQVYYLDKCWGPLIGRVTGFKASQDTQTAILTPFPGEERQQRPPGSTIIGFLETPTLFPSNNIESLVIKAATTFEQCINFSTITMKSQDAPDWTKYFKLQKVIEHINGSLPPVTAQSDIDLRIIVVHTLIHSSTIHLYLPFVSKDVNLQLLSLDAARAMLTVIQAIRPSRYQYLDPILAFCWKSAADVFIREKISVELGDIPDEASVVRGLQNELHVIITALRKLARIFSIAENLVRQVEEDLGVSPS
ncbi:hypothetical protein SISNIDRAFT_254324 [Sistotremastrum niveocremeum HHB9708]|uniref:Zn(2)-C6 fungal-type domain-containing protein n=1 Tax=Sistotremastrum niveocremeum HHB9708 TaxID=1314777 RepID=A0A164PK92_9AGAM|nr:hypothetical protein SISNIDRAFT_254324 [Sistotremastrum niveocremeum HHB9708]